MADRTDEQTEYSVFLRWSVAVVAPLLALAGNRAIPEGRFEAPLFIAAVMLTAQLGGKAPAALALAFSGALLDYYFIPPYRSFAIEASLLASVAQFLVPALAAVWFIEKRKDVELLLARDAALAKRISGQQTFVEMGRAVLEYLTSALGAPIAAFYTVDADGTAHRRATHAFDLGNAPEVIAPGEGVIGQAVTQKQMQIVSVPPDYVTVRSSLGARRPSLVVVLPAFDAERTHAVLELGFFGRIDAGALRLLQRFAEPLAIAVRTTSYRKQLEQLLDATRRQAAELEAHDEQLRVANEELEERGQAMAESQQKLEEQQIELERTNEILTEQARQLEHQNDELGQAHEVVRIKSEAAERANRTKSEFLANMSHELRTPLNSSLILAKLLVENREGNLTADQVRFAENIHSAGTDLLIMIDDILDLAKIEAGRVDLRIEEVPLARVVDDVMRMFEPVAKERRLAFAVRIAEGTPSALPTDAPRLAQILRNLLSNAFKFTERGEVSLSVERHGDVFQLVVRDTGIGIHADQLDAVFDAFRQADGTTNRRYGGTGLGLSISRDLARMLGGDIHVVSTVGEGSTFTLTLPPPSRSSGEGARARPASPSLLGPAPRLAAASQPVAAADGRTILVVEDDPKFAEIVVTLARELSFSVMVASTAEEALRLAFAHPPKGIVLDMKLPDHHGMTVLEQLKRDPRTRHIPVHVISVADFTRAALEMGAIGYMLKPVQREQIKAALQKLETEFTRTLRRLLVVDADVGQRESIVQLLEADNVEIVAVGTAKEALAQLRAGGLDCVVTDLTLPDASGYELLERMAEDESYAFPSVVVYTARPLTPDDEQRLSRYSSSIIMKSARSPERLLDEVTLFLHQVESVLPPERRRMLRRARSREAIFEDRRVLVVEDDVRNVFALTSALEPKGMKVTIARNGREALAALDRDPTLEIVLMDIMMPEMDGFAAMRAIRADARWAKLPIIALTAKAMKDDQERCTQAGASDYIAKPLDIERLLSLLRVWISR